MSNPNGGAKTKEPNLTCGLIMPISALDGCSSDHWLEVKTILVEAVASLRPSLIFTPRLVSDADEIGVIQKRILQNVYNSTIVVCDVSGKNPNVMFELGLRLAFDKPTVIIKDDKTDYSFDTGVIEHLSYPRDLRFTKIVEFKKKLAEKIEHTYKASVADPSHSPFLKSFGEFHVASLAQTEAPADKVMLEMLLDMQRDMQLLKRRTTPAPSVTANGIEDYRSEAYTMGALLAVAMQLLPVEGIAQNDDFPSELLCTAVARKVSNMTGRPIPIKEAEAALMQAARELGKFGFFTAPKSERP